MNGFFKGLLVGVGVGLLVAPMRGEEMRQRLSERFDDLRSNLPEGSQVNQYYQQVSDRVGQTAGTLKDYGSQAAARVRSTTNDLSNLGQSAAGEVVDSSKDVASTTKQTAANAKSKATNSNGFSNS